MDTVNVTMSGLNGDLKINIEIGQLLGSILQAGLQQIAAQGFVIISKAQVAQFKSESEELQELRTLKAALPNTHVTRGDHERAVQELQQKHRQQMEQTVSSMFNSTQMQEAVNKATEKMMPVAMVEARIDAAVAERTSHMLSSQEVKEKIDAEVMLVNRKWEMQLAALKKEMLENAQSVSNVPSESVTTDKVQLTVGKIESPTIEERSEQPNETKGVGKVQDKKTA